ncbi:hypothetical protein [Bradyrhizobium glycinis]|uniref:hypothetical protein n=1 Tax=Bradyrhizobium glycinis TaxID=2751812 RepID=UPI0018D91C5F|nr:hypothetical protein [Bradyrhizobium glycinis]MBH5373377.1 hypothetical protein [Bradyrhizobium glycinis]
MISLAFALADTTEISAAQQQSIRFAPTKGYRFLGIAEKEFGLDSLGRNFSETIDRQSMVLGRGMLMTCTDVFDETKACALRTSCRTISC